MDIAHIVAEDKIKRAIKDGEFAGINGMGKPLPKWESPCRKTMPHIFRSRSEWATAY